MNGIDLTKYASHKSKSAKIRAMHKDGYSRKEIEAATKFGSSTVSYALRKPKTKVKLLSRQGRGKTQLVMNDDVRAALAAEIQSDPRLPPNTKVFIGPLGTVHFFELRKNLQQGRWVIEPINPIRIDALLGEIK